MHEVCFSFIHNSSILSFIEIFFPLSHMAPPRSRSPASCWTLAVLVGFLAIGSALPSFQTGNSSDQDQVCTSLLDVMLVVDESGSIGASNYQKVRSFLGDFIKSMPVSSEDVRIGLITFATTAVTRWDLSSAKAQDPVQGSQAALSIPYAAGLTYTDRGLTMASDLLYNTQKGGRANVPKLVLVMTDGGSNLPAETSSTAKALREKGAIIVVLGVGSGVVDSECRNIAGCSTTTCERYLRTDWSAVAKQVEGIIQAACKDLAKDAVCSDWSEFGECEGECGKQGVRTSTRVEISPQRPGTPPCPTCEAPKGRSCAEQSPGLIRTEPCVMPVCKVDAHCGEFGPWSAWSASCGTATRKRTRVGYNNPPASGGGLSCSEQSPPKEETETETVDKTPCPVNQKPGQWGDWSECSATCGGGKRTRIREGIPQEGELYGGETLESQGISAREEETCNPAPCPVDATCGLWGEYSECSRSCGGGTQKRTREPWLDNAQHGGRSCLEQHPEGREQTRSCNTQPCPVNEVPGDWGPWGPCSEQCGPGTQSRHREESKVSAQFGGKTIQEQNEELPEDQKILLRETRECENNPCGPCTLPFTEWTACLTCSGNRTRHTMVLFDYYDGKCKDQLDESESCEGHCPATGGDSGNGGRDEEREEGSGFPTAAVAGGVAGGLLLIAAAGGGAAAYSHGGGGGAEAPTAGEEVTTEAPESGNTEVERESLVSPGEQTEMWAA